MYIFSNCCATKENEYDDDNNEEVNDDSSPSSAPKAPTAIQLYSFFNVLVALPPSPPPSHDDDSGDGDGWTRDNILDREFLRNFVQSHVPDGIRAECEFEKLLDGGELRRRDDGDNDVSGPVAVNDRTYAVYRIVLYGEGRPLTQSDAEMFRIGMEEQLRSVDEGSSMNRWCASNVYPCSIMG